MTPEISLLCTSPRMEVQSNLAIRNFLVALKLFLNAKSSLSLWSKWLIGHRKWLLNTNLSLIKPFLIAKFDCTRSLEEEGFVSVIEKSGGLGARLMWDTCPPAHPFPSALPPLRIELSCSHLLAWQTPKKAEKSRFDYSRLDSVNMSSFTVFHPKISIFSNLKNA